MRRRNHDQFFKVVLFGTVLKDCGRLFRKAIHFEVVEVCLLHRTSALPEALKAPSRRVRPLLVSCLADMLVLGLKFQDRLCKISFVLNKKMFLTIGY